MKIDWIQTNYSSLITALKQCTRVAAFNDSALNQRLAKPIVKQKFQDNFKRSDWLLKDFQPITKSLKHKWGINLYQTILYRAGALAVWSLPSKNWLEHFIVVQKDWKITTYYFFTIRGNWRPNMTSHIITNAMVQQNKSPWYPLKYSFSCLL